MRPDKAKSIEIVVLSSLFGQYLDKSAGVDGDFTCCIWKMESYWNAHFIVLTFTTLRGDCFR